MIYPDWVKQVDDALRANHRGFTAAQIDLAAMQAAYQAGQSPVLFARAATPVAQMAPATPAAPAHPTSGSWATVVPLPDNFVCSVTCRSLSIVGWVIWVIGFLFFLIWIFAMAAGVTSSKDAEQSYWALRALVEGWPFALFGLIVWVAFGGICHWFAQMLAINYHKH